MQEVADYALSQGTQVLCIDEGQFFRGIAGWADFLAYRGMTILIAALDSNFLK